MAHRRDQGSYGGHIFVVSVFVCCISGSMGSPGLMFRPPPYRALLEASLSSWLAAWTLVQPRQPGLRPWQQGRHLVESHLETWAAC